MHQRFGNIRDLDGKKSRSFRNPIFWCVSGLSVYRVCICKLSMYKVRIIHRLSMYKVRIIHRLSVYKVRIHGLSMYRERIVDKIMEIFG